MIETDLLNKIKEETMKSQAGVEAGWKGQSLCKQLVKVKIEEQTLD